eukprot:366577-Chlamydomonas_euryale.AAC.14
MPRNAQESCGWPVTVASLSTCCRRLKMQHVVTMTNSAAAQAMAQTMTQAMAKTTAQAMTTRHQAWSSTHQPASASACCPTHPPTHQRVPSS